MISDDEVALLIPGYGGGALAFTTPNGTANRPPAAAPAPVIQAMATPAPAPPAPLAAQETSAAIPAAACDPVGGIRENMPYALARPKLFAAGWQTQFFSVASLSDSDRDIRQWFIDHHITEVQDCSSSGCKLQFHNGDGRLLYVYSGWKPFF